MSKSKIFQSLAVIVLTSLKASLTTLTATLTTRLTTGLTTGLTITSTIVTLGVFSSLAYSADNFIDALSNGKTKADFRLRLEDVDTAANDATAMTLRSRLNYTTDSYQQFSATIEVEDVRSVLGVDSYSVPQTGFNSGEHAVIPDPEVTELEQAYLQYKDAKLTAKLGRQLITLDDHRFVGHVGWRQDRQTFDAARLQMSPAEGLNLDLSYIYKRNRIFAEALDAKADDLLLNLNYSCSHGKLTTYAYLLDDETLNRQSDTYGIQFSGQRDTETASVHYKAAFATQQATQSGVEYDPNYLLLEGGVAIIDMDINVAYEVLGSDNGQASFTTPLATLHKFNGWADVFVASTFTATALPLGLIDTSVSISGKTSGKTGSKMPGIKWSAVFHSYDSDQGSVDYGSEFDLVASMKFNKHYSGGIKYASYNADSFSVDTDKFWLWVGLSLF
ncbi:MAG: alginate export family protein [Pseudomonadales bacterium]|nr:alginate export family protein [Pseudomonadales bacterium]